MLSYFPFAFSRRFSFGEEAHVSFVAPLADDSE